MASEQVLEFSGQIDIQTLKLIGTSGYIVDLEDYLIELNLYEDIFSNFLHGQIQLSDSRNLIASLPILGEEYLILTLQTPSINTVISKSFKVYSVTDRQTVRDNNTQIYTLHFCSYEAIVDMLSPLYRPFEGKISDIVSEIYQEYLEVARSYDIDETKLVKETQDSSPLYILNEVQNRAKFISPGWTPAKCINWLASKAIPEEGKACDYLFWETSQGFYFGNIEKIISDTQKYNDVKGVYSYYPTNVNKPNEIDKKMFVAEDFEIIKNSDNIENYTNGYLANRILTLDLHTKSYKLKDFDYVDEFKTFKHSNINSEPIFASDALRNPATHIKFYPVNPKLFTGFTQNISEKIEDVYGNRISRLADLNNFRINITIPGRCDLEVGSIIEFQYPDTREHEISTESGLDPRYSGIYLITAIRHKINLKRHMIIMEMVKDSLEAGKREE